MKQRKNEENPENIKRIEFTRIRFAYIGKILDMLVEHPDEAKIILVLSKGKAKTHMQIVNLSGVPESNVTGHLQTLINKKSVIRVSNRYSLTETGEMLANAWTTFIQTLDLNCLPEEQIEKLGEIIKETTKKLNRLDKN